MDYKEFNHLVLLIGTNPLPNFVVADYFLQSPDNNIQTIWLVHSEQNKLQAGTDKQAKNLEALLRKRWEGKRTNLRFPLEKISLSDVSDAASIRSEIERKMLRRWGHADTFHLNYTGGTKAMATHVHLRLQELQKSGQRPFSYLDANNFRLVVDDYGIIANDLRREVRIEFADLIALHGFQRINKDREIDLDAAQLAYKKFLDIQSHPTISSKEGYDFEAYIFSSVNDKLKDKLNNETGVWVLHNWLIRNPNWWTKFELDVMVLHGYHLTGISCTASSDKISCKPRGFEIILRTRQIGGDEARAILITRTDRNKTQDLQDELALETGGNQDNILVLGVEDLRHETHFLDKIKEFVLD